MGEAKYETLKRDEKDALILVLLGANTHAPIRRGVNLIGWVEHYLALGRSRA